MRFYSDIAHVSLHCRQNRWRYCPVWSMHAQLQLEFYYWRVLFLRGSGKRPSDCLIITVDGIIVVIVTKHEANSVLWIRAMPVLALVIASRSDNPARARTSPHRTAPFPRKVSRLLRLLLTVYTALPVIVLTSHIRLVPSLLMLRPNMTQLRTLGFSISQVQAANGLQCSWSLWTQVTFPRSIMSPTIPW